MPEFVYWIAIFILLLVIYYYWNIASTVALHGTTITPVPADSLPFGSVATAKLVHGHNVFLMPGDISILTPDNKTLSMKSASGLVKVYVA